jgi:protein-S-isoprenylcysteine O-methyltransferase Ste14
VLSVIGLAILIVVGRKLAVNVYRLAVPERKLMTTGVHRYVRHPFYVHFVLIPVGSFLVSLNYLVLLLLVAYTMQWEPKLLTS